MHCKLTSVGSHPSVLTIALEIEAMQTPLDVGVDVGKREVMVACAGDSFAPHKLGNERTALKAWLKSVPKGSRLGVESTSSYHELIVRLALARGLVVYVLNPKDVCHYAKAMGARGKTDRVDAQSIARLIAHEHAQLHPYVAPSTEQRQIALLLRRRGKLTAMRAQLLSTLKGVAGLSSQLKALRARFDAIIARIDTHIDTLMAASPARAAERQRLRTIVGVGPVTSAALTPVLERYAFKKADSFVAFLGYDPRAQDSAQRRGRRRLSKRGPSELRRLLFNAARAAVKTKSWKPIYEHYLAKGLATTECLVIIARKIARTAWSMYTHGRSFDVQRLLKTA
jgi:transposase